MSHRLEKFARQLLQETEFIPQTLDIKFGECAIRVQSNSDRLIKVLSNYFRHWIQPFEQADIDLMAIESEALKLNAPFQDWQREPGKKGRKDAYYNFDQGRLVHKIRTGMYFLQSANYKIAAGPCIANSNQVINFINSQYMNELQQHDWQICHAAAVVYQGYAYAMAGFSGGGKSTFMLNLLAQPDINYLTNDRLFIRYSEEQCFAAGIAKLPRINPGTIVHNPKLHDLISEQQRAKFLQLPKQSLWDLEEKYDVDIEAIYGADRITNNAPLKAFIILNWQHNSQQPCRVDKVDLSERRDLLAAVMKSPGPFYQDEQGQFISDCYLFDESAYLAVLSKICIYEVSGQVDFAVLQRIFNQHIIEE